MERYGGVQMCTVIILTRDKAQSQRQEHLPLPTRNPCDSIQSRRSFHYIYGNYLSRCNPLQYRETAKSRNCLRRIHLCSLVRDLLHYEGHQVQSSPRNCSVRTKDQRTKTDKPRVLIVGYRYAAVLSAFLSDGST
jgi:hypothetical protein